MKKIIYNKPTIIDGCGWCPFVIRKRSFGYPFIGDVNYFCARQLDAKNNTYPSVHFYNIHPGCPLEEFEETEE